MISPRNIAKAVAVISATLVVAFFVTLGAYKLYLSTQIGHAVVTQEYTSQEGGAR